MKFSGKELHRVVVKYKPDKGDEHGQEHCENFSTRKNAEAYVTSAEKNPDVISARYIAP